MTARNSMIVVALVALIVGAGILPISAATSGAAPSAPTVAPPAAPAAPVESPAAKARRLKAFDQADANHDGRVTFDEFRAYEEPRLKKRFDHADADHNGAISKDEWLAGGRSAHRPSNAGTQ